jgi:hypothetical protein
MKRLIKKTKKLVKGMPSAVVVSILVHAGLFLLLGGLIIFKFIPQPPPKFEPPPPVVRPKMPLKKLQIKLKKPTKPKATAKIVAVVKQVKLTDIAFPDLPSGGMGAGIGGGADVVDFLDMPGLDDDDGLLGGEKSVGNDLEGTYYDIKRRRSGTYNGEENATWTRAIEEFIQKGWDTSTLARFYRSPVKRYATCVMVPTMSSSIAPSAFGEDPGSGLYWIVHYKGQIVYPEDITFRFWCAADGFMAVRVNGEMVLFDAWRYGRENFNVDWRNNNPQSNTYRLGHDTFMEVGDWVTLKAGVPQDIEVLIGDEGGLCALMLVVEVKGVDYPRNKQGGPILPVFKTGRLSHDLIDRIYMDLSPNECCLTHGPVFSDY